MIYDREHLAQDVEKYRVRDFAQQLIPTYYSMTSQLTLAMKRSLDARISDAVLAGLYTQAALTCHADTLYKTIPMSTGNKVTLLSTANTASANATMTETHSANEHESSATVSSSTIDYDQSQVKMVHIHPQSALTYTAQPAECIVYVELVRSASKLYLRHVTAVSKKQWQWHRQQYQPVSIHQLSQNQLIVMKSNQENEEEETAITIITTIATTAVALHGKKRTIDDVIDRTSNSNNNNLNGQQQSATITEEKDDHIRKKAHMDDRQRSSNNNNSNVDEKKQQSALEEAKKRYLARRSH
jgi:hypothetical protein